MLFTHTYLQIRDFLQQKLVEKIKLCENFKERLSLNKHLLSVMAYNYKRKRVKTGHFNDNKIDETKIK